MSQWWNEDRWKEPCLKPWWCEEKDEEIRDGVPREDEETPQSWTLTELPLFYHQ